MLKKKSRIRGAALVEYGIIVGLLSIVAIGVITEVGETTADTMFTAAATMEAVKMVAESGSGGGGPSGPPDYNFTAFIADLGGGDYGFCSSAQCSGPGSHPVDTSGGFLGISVMNGVTVSAFVGPSSGVGDTYIVLEGDQRSTFAGYTINCGPGFFLPADSSLTYDGVDDETTMVYGSGAFSSSAPNDQISCNITAP